MFINMDRFPSRLEFFGSTIKHLLRQRVRSADNSSCMYRAEVKECQVACAVGAWVPNSEYTPNMEGASRDRLIKRPYDIFTGHQPHYKPKAYVPTVIMLDGQFGELVWELQRLHDGYIPMRGVLDLSTEEGSDFIAQANIIAATFKLLKPFVAGGPASIPVFTYDWCP